MNKEDKYVRMIDIEVFSPSQNEDCEYKGEINLKGRSKVSNVYSL